MNKLRVFEAFAGIGTQRMALKRLGINHEVVGISEIDKFAIKSYEAIHGETKNFGDISKLDTKDLPDFDLFTYSFPCQDISTAGKQAGFDKDSGTRSSLLWECERIIEAKRPKYLLMENVKALTFKKNISGFNNWLKILEDIGYKNYWKVLNAKDYGVPQNRERVFCISILDDNQGFEFPEKQVLETRIKDVLEKSVDEKYYLSNDRVKQLVGIVRNWGVKGNVVVEPEIMQTHKLNKPNRKNPDRYRVFDKDGISPTLTTCQGGGLQPCVSIDLPAIAASRGRNPNNPSDRTKGAPTQQRLEINKKGTSNTITTVQKDNLVVELRSDEGIRTFKGDYCGTIRAKGAGGDKMVIESKVPVKEATKKGYDYRIRKLTPLECWRLMGINDEDFYKAQKVNSNRQLYKQAGNAIVVDVLEAIFKNLFVGD